MKFWFLSILGFFIGLLGACVFGYGLACLLILVWSLIPPLWQLPIYIMAIGYLINLAGHIILIQINYIKKI